jgi:hypothetical protein
MDTLNDAAHTLNPETASSDVGHAPRRSRGTDPWETIMRITGTTLGLCALLASTVWAGTTTKTCYHPDDDWDNDGYAREGATRYVVAVGAGDLNCPHPFVSRSGDCNDSNYDVHPRNSESTGRAGIDDNCNGIIDEPEFTPFGSWQEPFYSNHKIRLTIQLNHYWHLLYRASGWLWYRTVSYALNDSSTPLESGYVQLPMVSLLHARDPFTIEVNVPDNNTVYRTKVMFFHSRPELYQRHGGYHLPPDSDYYFGTTSSTTNEVSRVRTQILQRGFNDHNLSRLGLIGYRGEWSPDGTRYGASYNEKWCTEFYSNLSGDLLKRTGNETYVGGMIWAFRWYGNYYDAHRIDDLATRADYMPEGPPGEDAGHSTMFLAIDTTATPNLVWTLEGNRGNQVSVFSYPIDSGELKGLGHIATDQLD